MKRIQLLLSFFFIWQIATSQIQATPFVPKTKEQQELVRLTKLMCSASERGDASVYEHYIDKDFLITYSRCQENSYGKFMNKASVVARWGKHDSTGQSHSTPTVYEVQLSGKTAIVHSYILDEWIDSEGKKISAATWATDVWVKRKKQWYWISSHESVLF